MLQRSPTPSGGGLHGLAVVTARRATQIFQNSAPGL